MVAIVIGAFLMGLLGAIVGMVIYNSRKTIWQMLDALGLFITGVILFSMLVGFPSLVLYLVWTAFPSIGLGINQGHFIGAGTVAFLAFACWKLKKAIEGFVAENTGPIERGISPVEEAKRERNNKIIKFSTAAWSFTSMSLIGIFVLFMSFVVPILIYESKPTPKEIGGLILLISIIATWMYLVRAPKPKHDEVSSEESKKAG